MPSLPFIPPLLLRSPRRLHADRSTQAVVCIGAMATGAAAMLVTGGGMTVPGPALLVAGAMCAALLGGAMASVLLVAGTWLAALATGQAPVAPLLLTSLAAIAGVLLRRGCRADLMLAFLVASQWLLSTGTQTGPDRIVAAAAMLAQTGAGVTLATLVQILLPQRGRWFPVRARVQWHHLAFALSIGPASVCALIAVGRGLGRDSAMLALGLLGAAFATALMFEGLIAWTVRQSPGWQESVHGRRWLRLRPAQRRMPASTLRLLLGRLQWGRRQLRLRHRLCVELDQQRAQVTQMRLRLQDAVTTAARQKVRLERLVAVHAHAVARYRSLLANARDVEMFVDARGAILAASPSVQPLLGFEPIELVGRLLRTLIPAHYIIEHPFDHLTSGALEMPPDGIEAPVAASDGSTRDLLVQVRRLAVGSGFTWAIQLHDAGGMKKAIATMERARMLERTAHQSRDLFIATMSHELRTPLHGLIATLDMMRGDEQLPPQFEQRLAIARISARALLRIANDVLDLTRIESGHFQLEQKPFDLERIVEEVVDESRARADSLGLTLAWRLRDALPPSFLGDAARLKQVIGNLVSNALQCTSSGGVTVDVAYDGRQCTIDVIDTGSGIPADKWQTIFDPFVQVPATRNRRVGGTGLGLPISRRLIEAMGGKLNLARSDSSGSVFSICAPLPASDQTPEDEQSARIFNNPRARVLVVEDNPANRYVAEALLASLECPATLVESGEEALRVLVEQEFDLVLMDCQMPGMDGYEATRRARALLKKRIPIIAMTANAMMDDRRHCIEAGMDDFLAKPFGRHTLHAMLCKWLDPEARRSLATAADETAHRAAALPALDLGVFEELRESLQWRLQPLRNIRDTFAASARGTAQLLDGSAAADPHQLRRHLHTLLGSAGMVGARQVEYLAQRLQAAFEARDQQAVDACVPMLREAVARFEREFDQRLEQSAPERDWTGRHRSVPSARS